jgi:predicted acylesterase/phospholipase RssA
VVLSVAVLGGVLRAQTQRCSEGRTALVLAGGGAKGLAHIGVIRALERRGIRPDLIVGTSMGALIGALYASGYTSAQLDTTLGQLGDLSAFGTYAPRPPASLRLLPATVLFERTTNGFVLQRAAGREGDVNALLDAILLPGNLIARGDFDSLRIPFRAVATDLKDRSIVVLGRGDLAQAVRASIALPLLFAPVSLDGRLLADGGLSANEPVDVARELGAEHVFLSRMTTGSAESVDFRSSLEYAEHLVTLLFQQARPTLNAGDVEILTPLGDVSRLDFSLPTGRVIVSRGESAATQALAQQCPSHSGSVARSDASVGPGWQTAPVVRLGSVTAEDSSDTADLTRLLGLQARSTMDVSALATRLHALRGARSIEGVWLNPTGPRDSVQLRLSVERGPRSIFGAGFAFDSDVGGRVWAGLVDRAVVGRGTEGSVIFAGGKYRQELSVGLRRVDPTGVNALSPLVSVAAATEEIRSFDRDGMALKPLSVREVIGFTGIERAAGDEWIATVGAETRAWEEPRGRDRVGVGPRLTLVWRPPDGRGSLDLQAIATGYERVEVEGARNVTAGRLTVRPRARFAWGQQLPLQLTFPLGGNDGFAGLRRDELRGERELFAAMLLAYRITGPLLVRAELMAGEIAYRPYVGRGLTLPTTMVLPLPDRLFGARAGFGLETPVGPVRVEYGLNSRGRHSSFIRLGRWF